MRRILALPLAVKLLSASIVTLIAVAMIVGLAARLQYQTMLGIERTRSARFWMWRAA